MSKIVDKKLLEKDYKEIISAYKKFSELEEKFLTKYCGSNVDLFNEVGDLLNNSLSYKKLMNFNYFVKEFKKLQKELVK
jgi:hypothetical protein